MPEDAKRCREKADGEYPEAEKPEDFIAERWYGKDHAAYDQNAKKLLSGRRMLAEIVKRTVAEFQDVSTNEIAKKCIEGKPEVGRIAVYPDETNAVPPNITGDRQEDGSVTEGYITYDILFHARVPRSGEIITLIINIEAQRTQDSKKLKYHLMKRSVYYACRLISSQKEREFSKSDYDGIKKVYSIWICMDSPNGKSAINRYRLHEEHLLHRYKEPEENFDLVNIVMVYLGEKADKDRLVHLLQVLFTESDKTAEQKKQILTEEYGIEMTKAMEEELRTMCNLSLGLTEKAWNRGVQKGREEGRVEGREEGREEGQIATLCKLVKKGILSLNVAAKEAGMTEEKFKKIAML